MPRRDEISHEESHPIYARFLDMVAKSGEHFQEYVVIVKTPNGSLDWRSSDKTWAMGATARYLELAHGEDHINLRRSVE